MTRILWLVLTLVLASPSLSYAQTGVRLMDLVAHVDGSIDANAESVDINLSGRAGVGIQITGTFTGTIQFEVSGDNANWETLTVYPSNSTTGATTTTGTGIWYGTTTLEHMRVVSTAWTSGTAVVTLEGVLSSSGSGGGGGAASTITDIQDGAGDSVMDAANDAIQVNVVAGAAGGVSDTDDTAFAAGDSIAPAGYWADMTTPDSVDEGDIGAPRMTLARIALATIWDAAGNERGLNVDASGGIQVTWDGTAPPIGAGTESTALRVTLATDSTGLVSVDDNSGSLTTDFSGQFAEDDALGATPSGVLGLGVYDATLSSLGLTDGDAVAPRITPLGAVAVRLTDASGYVDAATDVTEDAAETAGGTGPMVLGVRRDAAASSAGTTGDNATFNTDALGLMWTRQLDPCSGVAKTYVPVDIVTATTTQLAANSSGNYHYVCSVNLVTASANNVSLVEDDTAACASPTAGVAGGTTAAEGWNLAANGGLTLGNGNGSVARTAATNRYICLITSAAVQLSGTIVLATAP